MRIWLVIMLYGLIFSNAYSFPGEDVVLDLKKYWVMVQQLQALQDQLSQGDALLSQGKQLLNGLEGHYGFGQLNEDDTSIAKRQWGYESWEEALKQLSGNNPERYQQLKTLYQAEHPILSDHQFLQGASESHAKSYHHLAQTNQAASVFTNYEYKQLNARIQAVHQLANKIENASNVKSAIDLNSRLLAELSYLSVEQLRMLALSNQQMSASQANQLDAMRREAIFRKLPQEEKNR